MKEGNELSELLSSFFVRKMKSVILRYFINWFIDVQYSVVIMYKERRCYNASNQTNYRFDICFMGALEVDRYGNINAHRGPGAFAGIGGFANITAKTPTVVFCMTFDAKGLDVTQEKGVVTIRKEGEIPKFVEKVNSVSFSAKRAIENGQKVLYVTERCVFRLTPKGLKLIEVYPGVDMQKDILDRLPFEVEI